MQDIQRLFSELKGVPHKDSGFTHLSARKDRLLRLKALLNDNEDALYKALKEDLGKSSFDSYLTEIALLHEEIDSTLRKLKKWMRPQRVGSPLALFPVKSFVHSRALGTVLIISPWNYPVQLIFSPLVGALAAGNNIILKPSEVATSVSALIAQLIPKYFKSFEISVVEGAVEETTALLELPFDHIFFTGSTPIGKIIMQKAAAHLTPVTLELGGKSPCFLFSDHHFDLAVKRIIWGKFLNVGQTCVAPDYLLLPEGRFDEFLASAKKWIQHFYGDDLKVSSDYGKIINHKHFDRLVSLVENEAPELEYTRARENRHLGPVIFKANLDSDVMKDEIFGPLLPVIEVSDFDEALKIVASREHPLAAYLFTEDPQKRDLFLSGVQAGGACINDTIVHLSNKNLPFGGVGSSGLGAYHGKRSFETFSHQFSVMKRSFWLENSLRYPPAGNKLGWLKKILPWVS